MYRYKTKGDAELMIPGVGITVNGEISSPIKLENPNLVLVTEDPSVPQQPQQPVNGPVVPAPGHLNGVISPTTQSPIQPQQIPVAPGNVPPVVPASESENQ